MPAAASIAELEAEVDRLHSLAQQLNKEGRFKESVQAYKDMQRVDDVALQQLLRAVSPAQQSSEPARRRER